MADPFEEPLHLEEEHLREGFEEGVKAGRVAGRSEGKHIGLYEGFKISLELGFYAGCVQIWRQLEHQHPEFTSIRGLKAIAALEEALKQFPMENSQDDGLQDAMDAVRGKFKAAAMLLGSPELVTMRETKALPGVALPTTDSPTNEEKQTARLSDVLDF